MNTKRKETRKSFGVGSTVGQNTGENTGRRRGRIENLKPWPKGVSGNPSGRTENLRPPWPKGVSGNPGGRPKKQPITEAYLEVAGRTVPGDQQGRTYAQAAAERQFGAALKGSTSAIREIADRLEGKPQQRIEMTHQDDFLAGRTNEELEFFAVHGYWPDDAGNTISGDEDGGKEKLQ